MPTPQYDLEGLSSADDWATKATKIAEEAIATSEILDEQSKDLLSAIMTRIAKGMEYEIATQGTIHKAKPPSEASLERMARGDEEWKVFQEGRFAAKMKMAEHRARMKNAVRHWESVVNGLRFKKAEMERISG